MASTNLTANGRAAEIGREHRAAFLDEFGAVPAVGEVGDWDATGVSEMWAQVGREIGVEHASPEGMDLYREARIAYLEALFGTEDVG